ncbi:MAG: 4Fe-4S binding protein [Methanoregula sp.]|nr:4Fe-4S binding protein [Methanoregula sp.]
MTGTLREQIAGKCAELEIPLVGFASARSWDSPPFEPWVPREFRPLSIWPEVKTVIVIGIPVSLPVLETAPSIWYHEVYRTVNTLLDTSAYRIAMFLTAQGTPAISVPRDGYGSIGVLREKPVAFFSHRHAAYLAGLGTFGINNMLLTPQFGPRVRFASIFTSAVIEPDPISAEQHCIHCMRCVEVCPVNAIPGSDYPEGITDKYTCATRSEALLKRFISPCGLCIKVCPVGEDRVLFKREDPVIYDEDKKGFDSHHAAWKHVQSYGGKDP